MPGCAPQYFRIVTLGDTRAEQVRAQLKDVSVQESQQADEPSSRDVRDIPLSSGANSRTCLLIAAVSERADLVARVAIN